jgi:hypothetical protein
VNLMSNVVPFDNPGDYARVHRRVKRLWNEGVFEIHQHAQLAMGKRKMDVLDVQNIILHGSIISHDLRDGQWRYRIQGGTVANVTASCVVAPVGQVLVVSVLDR